MRRRPLTRPFAAACAAVLLAAACGADGDDGDGDGGDRRGRAGDAPTEWLHLGRDLANTRATPAGEDAIGPGNVDQLEPAWEIDDVNGVTGTPIVDEGIVYFGDWTGHVRAVEAGTGDEVWATDMDANYVGGSVALDDDRVYVGTFDARTVALDRATGEQLWETPIGDHPTAAIFGSPMRVGDLVLVGVASFELITGQVAPSFRGHVVALDPATGEEAWRYWTTTGDGSEGPGVSVWSSPAVDEEAGVLYVGTGNTYVPPASPHSDALIALDLATGDELWVHQFTEGDTWTTANPVGPDADVGAPPNLLEVDGTAAVGVGDKAGSYHVLDRETGDELWSTELTEGGLQGGVLAGAAVGGDGGIYVASNKASTTADLVALDQASGEILWQVEVGGSVSGPVTWSNGLVLLADDSGHISAFDAGSGDRLWSHEVANRAAGGITVVDGTVYGGWGWWLTAPDDDPQGGLIAFRLPDADEGDGSGSGGTGGEAMAGDEVYSRHCAACHGDDGEGSSGPSLVEVADRLTVDEHLAVVRQGRGGRMPAWEDILSPGEIEAVVEYERTQLGG
jgi:polyvinyl alcohol dehydrogenase (cytochrome)